jgi:hypothetical protein
VVVGTHGRQGLERLLVGSVAEAVVRRASCPVLVVRPQGYEAAAEQAPAPEPPCPDCVERRRETAGADWWCTAHGRAWVPPSRYAYTAEGISRLRPDEWILW